MQSNGAMRAEGWNHTPIVRMSNINLLPGKDDFEDMIATTKDGILIKDNRSWSIDDKRLNFQFGAEIGWEIKDGKIVGIVKNPTYTGITPQFWRSCDAIANEKSYDMWGTPNCGKGQPMQVTRVGHGVSYARFNKVNVGVGYAE
jgi:TldD protein